MIGEQDSILDPQRVRHQLPGTVVPERADLGRGEQGEGGDHQNRLERRRIHRDSVGEEVEEGNECEAEEQGSYGEKGAVDWSGEELSLPPLV